MNLTYSDIVYLWADSFVPEAKMLNQKEQLPNGIKVNQKELADLVTASAFLYLKDKGYVDIYLKEEGILFLKSKNPYIKKLKEADENLNGLELLLLQNTSGDKRADSIVRDLIARDSYNPWEIIISFVKANLQQKGILQFEENGKVLFIQKYKAALSQELGEEEQQALNEFKTTLEKYKQQSDQMYDKLQKTTSNAIVSMLRQND